MSGSVRKCCDKIIDWIAPWEVTENLEVSREKRQELAKVELSHTLTRVGQISAAAIVVAATPTWILGCIGIGYGCKEADAVVGNYKKILVDPGYRNSVIENDTDLLNALTENAPLTNAVLSRVIQVDALRKYINTHIIK